MDVFKQNIKLGRGINILGYDPIWEDREQARMQARHFQLIAQAGFDSVQINLPPFEAMGPGPDYPIDPDWLETLDWAADQALASGLRVVSEAH